MAGLSNHSRFSKPTVDDVEDSQLLIELTIDKLNKKFLDAAFADPEILYVVWLINVYLFAL